MKRSDFYRGFVCACLMMMMMKTKGLIEMGKNNEICDEEKQNPSVCV